MIVSMRSRKHAAVEKAFLEYVPDEYVLKLHNRTKPNAPSM